MAAGRLLRSGHSQTRGTQKRRAGWHSRPSQADRSHRIRAFLAGDPGETISDFKFTPAAITVHVGDTITWVNNGPSEHSATANNGSFDTGLLKKGASASHTFTQAGTFTYFCSIHPFMHGTVVVQANTASSTPSTTTTTPTSTTPASTATTPTTTTPTSTASSLPNTGIDVALLALIGGGMAGIGIAARRGLRRQR